MTRLAPLFDLTGRHFDPLTASVFRFALSVARNAPVRYPECRFKPFLYGTPPAVMFLTLSCSVAISRNAESVVQRSDAGSLCGGWRSCCVQRPAPDGFCAGMAMRIMDVIFQFLSACRLLRKP